MRSRWGLWLAVALASYLALVLAFLVSHQILVTHDDAFIIYAYAQNLADGHGLTFTPGERVWGFTSPAQTLLLSFVAWLGFELPSAAQAIGFAFACGSGWLVFGILRRISSLELGAALGGLYLATLTPVSALFVTLEGNFLIFAQLACLELLLRKRAVAAALAGALSCLVRPDSVLLVVPLLVLAREARTLKAVAAFGLPGLLWVAFTAGYYGEILPTTLSAKSGVSSFFEYLYLSGYFGFATRFPANMVEFQVHDGWWLWGAIKLGLVAVGARAAIERGAPVAYALLAYPFVTLTAYAFIGAPQHHWEIQSASFFFHFAVVAGGLAGFSRVVDLGTRRGRVAAGLAAAVFAMQIVHDVRTTGAFLLGQQQWLWRGAKHRVYSDVARWVDANLPDGTRLAADEVGVLGFAANRFTIVDNKGLVSKIHESGGPLGDAEFLTRHRPDHVILYGDPRGRRYRGRPTQPLQTFMLRPTDFPPSRVTVARVLPPAPGGTEPAR